jgi:hypothetical protein
MRVLVSGSRYLTDEFPVRRELATIDQYAKALGLELTLLHGDARGADSIAAKIATEFGWAIEAFPADWEGMGRRAGYVRNSAMFYSGVDMLIAFPKGESKGTRHAIALAEKTGVRMKVIEL